MTPFELSLSIKSFSDRLKRERDEKLSQAWLTAYFQRVKKLPKLEKLLNQDKPKKPQTQEEMLNKIKELNAQFGGKVVRR